MSGIIIPRPDSGDYAEYYQTYIDLTTSDDIYTMLSGQMEQVDSLLAALIEEQGQYRYAEGKWSIKDILQHLIDGERVFAYRLLRIGRGDSTPLHGYDHDEYALQADAGRRSMKSLIRELLLLRESSLLLIESLQPGDWLRVGNANGFDIRVCAIPYIMAGHIRHHLSILRERYLKTE